MGVSVQILYAISNGSGLPVSVGVLEKLAGVLGMDLDEVAGYCQNLNCPRLEDRRKAEKLQADQPPPEPEICDSSASGTTGEQPEEDSKPFTAADILKRVRNMQEDG
jgi:transcriptional regulator with XRE-family HTH domain